VTVNFKCVGTGKQYTLNKGQSMNFIIYGKYTSAPIKKINYQVAAVQTSNFPVDKIDLPYVEFYSYAGGAQKTVVCNGNLDIYDRPGGAWYIKRR
jgi:hypothetical protein